MHSVVSWIFFGALGLWLLGCLVANTAGLDVPIGRVSLGAMSLSVGGFVFRNLANGSKERDGHDGPQELGRD